MSRINIDIDDEACAQVMAMYHLETKRDAVNLALRKLAVKPMSTDEILECADSGQIARRKTSSERTGWDDQAETSSDPVGARNCR
jgi:Arc/MetJ family transcription regulator